MHAFFGLTYANYLVVERTLIQSMPEEWQLRLCALLEEFDDATDGVPRAASFHVQSVGDDGRFVRDPVPPYDRGRARVKLDA